MHIYNHMILKNNLKYWSYNVSFTQEDYEVSPDENRKSRGEEIIKSFLSKQVSFFIWHRLTLCFSLKCYTKTKHIAKVKKYAKKYFKSFRELCYVAGT